MKPLKIVIGYESPRPNFEGRNFGATCAVVSAEMCVLVCLHFML